MPIVNDREYQFDHTSEVLSQIGDLKDSIKNLEDQIKQAKEQIKLCAIVGLVDAQIIDDQALVELATYLYWFQPVPAQIICEAFEAYPQNIQKYLMEVTLPVNCPKCNKEHIVIVRSRSHLQTIYPKRIEVC